MDEVRLQSYSKALEEFPDAAIDAVLDGLARARREEYEPRVPEKGELLDRVRKEARRRDRPKDCGICENRRMIIMEEGGMAKRCECWLEWKRAK
jgi:hypothetical protein